MCLSLSSSLPDVCQESHFEKHAAIFNFCTFHHLDHSNKQSFNMGLISMSDIDKTFYSLSI